MKLFIITIALLLPLTSVMADSSKLDEDGIRQADVESVQKLLTKVPATDVFLLDVRTSGEYNRGHIKDTDANANWFSWSETFHNLKNKPKKDDKIIVYCQSGGRSNAAASWLVEHGYKDVTNVIGGFGAWGSAGYPAQ